MEKRISRIDYIKRILINKDRNVRRCLHCKYSPANYKYIDKEAKTFFKEKCKHCTETYKHRKEMPYWSRDNFKPLYDWENTDEGVYDE